MSSLKPIHAVNLSNGMQVSMFDLTRRYFGDYHHVKLKVICFLDSSSPDWQQFCPADADIQSVSFTRIIDKMGVPSNKIDCVKNELLRDFHLNSIPYISSPEFPKKLIANEIASKKLPSRKYPGAGL